MSEIYDKYLTVEQQKKIKAIPDERRWNNYRNFDLEIEVWDSFWENTFKWESNSNTTYGSSFHTGQMRSNMMLLDWPLASAGARNLLRFATACGSVAWLYEGAACVTIGGGARPPALTQNGTSAAATVTRSNDSICTGKELDPEL